MSEEYFTVSVREYRPIPAKWTKAKTIDVVLCDSIADALGVGSFPWHGKHILVALRRMSSHTAIDGSQEREDALNEIARTWVHELGHYWGLEHRNPVTQADIDKVAVAFPQVAATMRPSDTNIMIQSGEGSSFASASIASDQLQDIHQKLARNLARQGDRQEAIANILI
ncbi:MAG: hypothetical protein HC869_26255 [Rhodospirillales bacterium]|nr:hypothetical protein [Rhodospirillales bacterium]